MHTGSTRRTLHSWPANVIWAKPAMAAWLGAMVLAGCGPKVVAPATGQADLAQTVEALEQRVAELEKHHAAPVRPATGMSPEDEQKAAELLKTATKATQQFEYDEAKAALAELKSEFGSSRAAQASVRLERELDLIGKAAGAVQVEKFFQGELETLEEGTTLLVFWEVWEPHSKREMPNLSETYAKFSGQGLNVLGLTQLTRNVPEEAVTTFLADHHIEFPIAKVKGDTMSAHFAVHGLPAAAVVKDGTIVWRGHPARLTDGMLESWL